MRSDSVPVTKDSGISVLGVPIDSEAYISRECLTVAYKAIENINALRLLNDTNITFTLLCVCFETCRMNAPLRSTPLSVSIKAAKRTI